VESVSLKNKMNIEVQIAGNEELKTWDALIESSPYGTIFHTLDWLGIAEKHTNSKLCPLIGVKGEEIIGFFPIFYKKKRPLKMVFSPPPKVGIPYLGPVLLGYDKLKQGKKESLITDFYTGVDKFIHKEIKPNYIYFGLPPGLIDCRPFKWLGYEAKPVYNYILDISIGLSNLESNFTQDVRKNIKKAEKNEIKVDFGSKKELKILYNILYDRYADQERKISISEKYLLDVFNKFFPDNLKVFTLIHQNTIIGGVIKLCYKDEILDWIGQSKTAIQGGNDFLHWEIIKWAVKNGYHYYNILGANTPSISRFKSKFNPALSVNFNVKKATISGIVAEKLYTKLRNYL
jgi:hypothetical protein